MVGAGLAGLACAWRLTRSGFEVRTFERADRPGGRAAGTSVRGAPLDPCAHLLSTADSSLSALLAELDLIHALVPWPRDAWAQVHRGVPRPIQPRGLLGIARIPEVKLRDAWRLLRFERLLARYGSLLDPLEPERAAPLDDRSLRDFARLYFGDSVLAGWMGPLVASTCLSGDRETSRVLFLLRCIAERDGAPATLRIGIDGVASALAARLRPRFAAEVMRVELEISRKLRIQVREKQVDSTLEADAVVLAAPALESARIAEDLLTPPERDFFNAVRYTAAITLAVAARHAGPLHVRRLQVPRREGWPLDAVGLEPGAPDGCGPEGCVVAVLIADDTWSREHIAAPDEALAKELLGSLGRLYPELRRSIVFTRLSRYPRAVPRFDVGRYRALARFQGVQVDLRRQGRRLYFAGDYLAAPSVEGALTAGLRAADAVCEDLGASTAAAAVALGS